MNTLYKVRNRETSGSNDIFPFEHQSEILHVCGFIPLGIHEFYSPTSKINARVLFSEYACDVPCLPSKAEYQRSCMLHAADRSASRWTYRSCPPHSRLLRTQAGLKDDLLS